MFEDIKKVKYNKIIKMLFIIASILFATPSIIYYMQNKTILNFNQYFKFLLNDTNRVDQTIIYIGVFAILTVLFFLIIKNRKTMFKNTKRMFIFIAIVATIFVIVIPFVSSDIFYYLGIGRIDSQYGQNPYYTTIKEFVGQEENFKYLEQDTVLAQGNINDWSDSTVVYGPVWTLICKIVTIFSFGNIDIGLLVFKIVNVLIHLINCYLIYKIANKKILVLLYGLNPYILIEGIACVHNDIFVVLFVLLSVYFLLKKKNIVFSIVFLALATAIKYFTILLLPFIIIYFFRKEKPLQRFVKCIQYGLLFLAILAIPYLLYIQDLQVLQGIFTQQGKYAKNFYIMIMQYFTNTDGLVDIINKTLLGIFIIIYFFKCVILLNKRNIKFRKEIQNANYFLIAFLFILITNFQPWYIMWLFPLLMWQKANMIKLIIQISLISQFANSVFLIYGEGWKNGTSFSFIFITSSLIMCIINQKLSKNRQVKAFLKEKQENRKGE